jgi:hypothetical protein
MPMQRRRMAMAATNAGHSEFIRMPFRVYQDAIYNEAK